MTHIIKKTHKPLNLPPKPLAHQLGALLHQYLDENHTRLATSPDTPLSLFHDFALWLEEQE